MNKLQKRGVDIRQFILENIETHPREIANLTAKKFNISRQAVHKHLQRLLTEKSITERGETKNKTYKLATLANWEKEYHISPELSEDIVWIKDIKPILGAMPDNIDDIWQYGFTEMFNNAIDHSEGNIIRVHLNKTAVTTEILIDDNGIGIFKKIQSALNLLDERHAILELSKGKLTTDPKRHSGEGIFFTSRVFDSYNIISGGTLFHHELNQADDDWIIERDHSTQGTLICMKLDNHTARTIKKVFDKYASEKHDYQFNKTVVPVKLAKYSDAELISRSQAKRLLARVELFKTVIFDFAHINIIGQAFADEIFRVFALQHPDITLQYVNASTPVEQMITRAKAHRTR